MDGFPFRGQFLPRVPNLARRAQAGRRPRRFIVRQPINPGLDTFAQFEAPSFVPDRVFNQLLDRELSGRSLRRGTYVPWGEAYPVPTRAPPELLAGQIGEREDPLPEGYHRSFVMQSSAGRLERRRARLDENHITDAFGADAFPPTPAVLQRNPGFWPPLENPPLWPILPSRGFIGDPLDETEAIRLMIDEADAFRSFQNFLPLWDAPLGVAPYRRSADASGPSLDDPFQDPFLNEPIYELNDPYVPFRARRRAVPKRDREEDLYQASFAPEAAVMDLSLPSPPPSPPRVWNDRPLKGRRLNE